MAGEKQIATAKSIAEVCPASPVQQEMLYRGLSAPHTGVNIEQVICTLPEELKVPALRCAWEQAVQRHTILRTGFRVAGLEPLQEVHRQVRLHFEWKDWSGLTEREQKNRMDAYLQAERRRGFELSLPPLMRLALFHAGQDNHILAWTFHHLLLDRRAVVVLLTEVFDFYKAICQGSELDLPAPRPFGDYVVWSRKRNRSNDEAFWRGQLKGFNTPTPLIGACSASEGQERYGCHHAFQQTTLSRPETARLRSVAKENGLTVNTLFQGAWAVLLARYSGEKDVVFGVNRECRGSSIEGAESIVGLFINVLPMRARVSGWTPVIELLKGLLDQHVAIGDHEHTPLVDVQGWSDLPPAQPLFQSVFNFQDPSWDAALRGLGGQWAKRAFSVRSQPPFPLWAEVHEGPAMTLKIGYDPGRFDDETVARMLRHFQSMLKAMAADLSQRVADLPPFTEAEEPQWLVEGRGRNTGFPRDQCVHELFETQVERTPDAVALVYFKGEVSYRELDNQANQVAIHLRSLCFGPDVRVGVCARRSTDGIIGLLGILKAGGVCLPLDPACPTAHWVSILEDSRVLSYRDGIRFSLGASVWELWPRRWKTGDLVRWLTEGNLEFPAPSDPLGWFALKSSEPLDSPRDPIDETMAQVSSQTLGRARLGVHDNSLGCGEALATGGAGRLAAQRALSRLIVHPQSVGTTNCHRICQANRATDRSDWTQTRGHSEACFARAIWVRPFFLQRGRGSGRAQLKP